MKLPTRTTLRIGNKKLLGFTFVEVMVTLVVLTTGIVLIYKTFFLCVDYFSRISARLCASQLVDERIADMARLMKESGGVSFDRGPMSVSQNINQKPTTFNYSIELVPVADYEGLYNLRVGIAWMDAGRAARFTRSSLISLW